MKNRKNTPQSELKIAIVTDPLIKYKDWYDELKTILEIFPNSEIFTPYYNPELIKKYFPNTKIHDSFLQLVLPEENKKEKWLKLERLAYKSYVFKKYDGILSMSERSARFANSKKLKHISLIMKPRELFTNSKFQKRDREALSTIDAVITHSISDKRKVKRVYDISTDVIYPPIETSKFKPEKILHRKENWFLTDTNLSRRSLVFTIKACVKANVPLKIVGELNDSIDTEELTKELKSRGLVKFLGEIPEKSKIESMQRCCAYIYPSRKNSFGRVAVEANAAGAPVIAYKRGSVIETVSIEHPETGVFFNKYNSDSLARVLKKFDTEKFDSKNCIMKAQEFDSAIFMYKLKNYVEDIIQSS